jgi:hypothetical protein
MFSRMKIYAVYIRPEAGAQQKPVFIKEGFNFAALVFTAFWALYQRLWVPMLLMAAFEVGLGAMVHTKILSLPSIGALNLGYHVIVGMQANDWVQSRLRRRGYVLADIAAADSLLRAEQRYFERHLAHA